MIKNPSAIFLGFFHFTIHCAEDVLNNTLTSSGFTPKELFTCLKGDRSFKKFHAFGPPTFVLDPTIQKVKKLPAWAPLSIALFFVGKSKDNTSNVSLACDPVTNNLSPQFHIVHDGDFQSIAQSSSNSIPLNWREVLIIRHDSNDASFTSPLIPKLQNLSPAESIHLNNDEGEASFNNHNSYNTDISVSKIVFPSPENLSACAPSADTSNAYSNAPVDTSNDDHVS